MVTQLTIRGVSEELAGQLKEISRSQGTSVNATVLRILEQALGVVERRKRLERGATWTDEDFEVFERALGAQRPIDKDLWHIPSPRRTILDG